jgi:hypothetical protein
MSTRPMTRRKAWGLALVVSCLGWLVIGLPVLACALGWLAR